MQFLQIILSYTNYFSLEKTYAVNTLHMFPEMFKKAISFTAKSWRNRGR